MSNTGSTGGDDFTSCSWYHTAPPSPGSAERPSTPRSAGGSPASMSKERFAQLRREILVGRKANIDLTRRIISMEEIERSTKGELEKLRERLRSINEQVEKDSIAIGALKMDVHDRHRMTVSNQKSLEFKVSGMLHKAQLEMDGVLHRIDQEDGVKNILGKLEALEKNLEKIRSGHGEFMASTNRELEILQTSHHQAARVVASLNRLGFKFGPLDLR